MGVRVERVLGVVFGRSRIRTLGFPNLYDDLPFAPSLRPAPANALTRTTTNLA